MTVNEFKKSYRDFLINVTRHSYNSANKYISYINKACLLPGMNDLWIRLSSCNDVIIKTNYVETLCDVISAAINDPLCTIKEKDLKDAQSSAHVLLAFVSGQGWTKYKGISIQFTSIYNHQSLRNIFLSRLTTQDRIYSFATFPINIIYGIANRKKISLFDSMIDNIKFIYNDKGDYYYFKEISRVMLATNGHAYFEVKGKVYPIYTQIPRKVPTEYSLAYAPRVRDLSLDHDKPIEKELRLTIGAMPNLNLLSTNLIDFKRIYKLSHPKADAREICRAYKNSLSIVDEDALIKEIQTFLAILSLTIMQCNLNSSKSNSI